MTSSRYLHHTVTQRIASFFYSISATIAEGWCHAHWKVVCKRCFNLRSLLAAATDCLQVVHGYWNRLSFSYSHSLWTTIALLSSITSRNFFHLTIPLAICANLNSLLNRVAITTFRYLFCFVIFSKILRHVHAQNMWCGLSALLSNLVVNRSV